MQWRNREKRNDKAHHVKARFFHLTDRKCLLHFLMLVKLFVFEKNVFFTSCCMLGYLLIKTKRSNSHSQIFFKRGVLKDFTMYIGKILCSSRFLIKFQNWRLAFLFEKRLQHKCFCVNIAKFLRTAFLKKTCSLYLSEILIDDK